VNLAVATAEHWHLFCQRVVRRPEWEDDPRFATAAGRTRCRAEFEALLEEAIAGFASTIWDERLRAEGIPYGAVRTIGDAVCHPQAEHRRMAIEAATPAGAVPIVRFPGSDPDRPRRVPAMGEHTRDILAGHGYSEAGRAGARLTRRRPGHPRRPKSLIRRAWSTLRRMQVTQGRSIDAADSGRNATADRAMELLMLFSENRMVLSAAEVASELGLSRSTTYRYLQSLRSYGLLEEDAGGLGFRLGPAIFELARIARKGLGLSEIAVPLMRDLAGRLDETVILTRRVGNQVVTIEREESGSPIRLSYERGHILPIHAGASASVLLAFASEAEIEQVLATTHLEKFTDRTISDIAEFRRNLYRTRARGYAVSRGELDTGVIGVAAPVLDAGNRPVAGLSAVALEFRVPDEKLPDVIEAVRATAENIAAGLRVIDS
jgi:DNA-binding IclR family transcriptional regulator